MDNSRPLLERAEAVLAYIRRFIDKHGYAPTVREIGAACQISSTSLVVYYLEELEAHNLIVRDYGTSRSIRLVDETDWRSRALKAEAERDRLIGELAAVRRKR